jgi:hypothetical protein
MAQNGPPKDGRAKVGHGLNGYYNGRIGEQVWRIITLSQTVGLAFLLFWLTGLNRKLDRIEARDDEHSVALAEISGNRFTASDAADLNLRLATSHQEMWTAILECRRQ